VVNISLLDARGGRLMAARPLTRYPSSQSARVIRRHLLISAGAELERVEEHKKLLLFGRAKLLKTLFHLPGFAFVPFNRAFQA
jgi:hypothetical protein